MFEQRLFNQIELIDDIPVFKFTTTVPLHAVVTCGIAALVIERFAKLLHLEFTSAHVPFGLLHYFD